MRRVHQELKDQGVEVISVDVYGGDRDIDFLAFLRQFGPLADHHWAVDRGQKVVAAYQVRFLGETYVIDPEGRVVYHDTIATSYEKLRQEVEKALARPGVAG